jgi:hypothetical protein
MITFCLIQNLFLECSTCRFATFVFSFHRQKKIYYEMVLVQHQIVKKFSRTFTSLKKKTGSGRENGKIAPYLVRPTFPSLGHTLDSTFSRFYRIAVLGLEICTSFLEHNRIASEIEITKWIDSGASF